MWKCDENLARESCHEDLLYHWDLGQRGNTARPQRRSPAFFFRENTMKEQNIWTADLVLGQQKTNSSGRTQEKSTPSQDTSRK